MSVALRAAGTARRLAVAWVVSLCPACSICVPIGWAGGELPFALLELTPVEVPSQAGGRGPVRGLLVKDPFSSLEVDTLRGGDIITSVDGRPVRDKRRLEKILSGHPPGMELRIGVLRGDEEKETKATTEWSGRLPYDDLPVTPVEVSPRAGRGRRVRGLLVDEEWAAPEALRDGDVVLSVDGVFVQDRRALEDVGRKLGPGRRVRIGVLRREEQTEVETTTERVGKYLELVITGVPPFLCLYPAGMPKTLLDVGDDERYRAVGPFLSVARGPGIFGVSLLGLIWFEADREWGLWTYWIGPVVLYYETDGHQRREHRFPAFHRVIG